MKSQLLTWLPRTVLLLCLITARPGAGVLPATHRFVITSISVQDTNVVLGAAVPAGIGRVTLQMRPTLAAPWKEAAALEAPSGGGQVFFTIARPGEMQFFRLSAPGQTEGVTAVSEELSYVTIAPLGASAAGRGPTHAAPAEADAVLDFKGMIDGSDHILLAREGALWQHAHWGWPQGAVAVNCTQWDPREMNYLTTVGREKLVPEAFSLDAVSLEVLKARDVLTLERTTNALVVHINDTLPGAGDYEFRIHFHPTRPELARPETSGAGNLRIAADIDGTDCLKITAREATWEHKHWAWPANVRLNDVPWPLQETNVWRNEGTTAFLPANVDLSTARIISRKGRDLATLWAEQDVLWVWFADNPNGTDQYELEIGFGR